MDDKNFSKEVKDLKNYALTMMRAGAELLDVAEVFEREVVNGHTPAEYKVAFIEAHKNWREGILDVKYKIPMSPIEKKLWNKFKLKEEN